MFEQGALWDRVTSVTAAALDQGALEPIDTDFTVVKDNGVHFLVRIVSKLAIKPRADSEHNPFLPYDKALHVADALPTHICVLNKYNVLDHHLLIITREFDDQVSLLRYDDFHALWRCMSEYESLGFYNSGTVSVKSQPHKHLQVVPLPLARNRPGVAVPIESLLMTSGVPIGEVVTLRSLPFSHAFVRWEFRGFENAASAADESLMRYREMLGKFKLKDNASHVRRAAGPYNLIVTCRWMMLVPRVCECFKSISFNSLAFAGGAFGTQRVQLAHLRAVGPWRGARVRHPNG